MVRPAHLRPDEDDEPDEEEEEDDEEAEDELSPRRRARRAPRRSRRHTRPRPVRRWREPGEDEEEEVEPAGGVGVRASGKKPVYWRARDSLFFEPLVALAIVVVLLVSLFAYTQNWPPVYVVESNSMQHGPGDQLGLINAGDLVLAQKTSLSSVSTYVDGVRTGYATYGEYGDVLLYWPNGQGSTPVIHRALLYLEWNPLGFYNATDLAGLPCGSQPNAVFATPGTTQNCNTTRLSSQLDLFRIGWNAVNITLTLGSPALGRHSGYLTMGDNNTVPDQSGAGSPAISELVEPGWVIGVARGMIPWFGAVKLLFEGQANRVPAQSWEYLGLTVVGVILAAFGIHYALRTEGIETPLRREEDEARSAAAEDADASWFHRFFSSLRHHPSEDEEEEEEDRETRKRHRTRPPPSRGQSRRGRPAPHVRRVTKPAKKHDSDDEL
jgi:signal peptidase I